jgi:Protein of unknown function (DUF2877).
MVVCTGNDPILGMAARGWLFEGQRGRVLAAVTHAIYLLSEDGDLVWLATPDSPMHRRCIQPSEPLPRLSVDSHFSIAGQSIDLEAGTILDFSSSQIWENSALPVCDVIAIEKLPAKLIAFYEIIQSIETPIGFGSFIPLVLQIAAGKGSFTHFQSENMVIMAAWQNIDRIAKSCISHDFNAVLDEAESLVGLGEGLTPSGDDFLGGLFFARSLLACAYPNLGYLQNPDLEEWIESIRPRTNLISYVLLKDNNSGHALEPLNRFGIAVLTDHMTEDVILAISDLIKVGHSTGWGLLAGFLMGMLLVIQQ